jgi:hypothetical protein
MLLANPGQIEQEVEMNAHRISQQFVKPVLQGAVCLSVALAGSAANAALVVTAASQVFGQNFDTLATSGTANAWTNDSTLPGWSLFRQPAPGTALAAYAAGTGSSNTGSFYSFGAAGNAERALGGVGSGGAYWGNPASGAVAGWIAAAFTNSSGGALDGFTVSFDGEQWRTGGTTTGSNSLAQTMVFEYGFGATFGSVATWIAPGGAFDFASPIFNTASFSALDGNAAANRVAGLGGLVATNWAANDTLWVRWIESNDLNNDHALAIDDFSFTAGRAVTSNGAPEPGTLALLGLGLAGLAATRRRKQ